MKNYPKPSWKVRRRIIHATLIFCVFCVCWIMFSKDTRSVAEVIVMCAFGLGAATIGSYIFGAVWDDKNYMSALKPKGDVAPSQWDRPSSSNSVDPADRLGD